MNELEFFLLKLHLCNLDLKNELRVIRYMLSFERCPSTVYYTHLTLPTTPYV